MTNSALEFVGFPKLSRLNRECVITEKLDGTNAAVVITDDGQVYAQSRTRVITPEDDNFGFAAWVAEHAQSLYYGLGPGRHFGEWWGGKIQRGYGLREKRFSLFNADRWANIAELSCGLIHCVPLLYRGLFTTEAVENTLLGLRQFGSAAVPGFKNPEGVVVYHVAANVGFKVTLDGDQPKGALPTTKVVVLSDAHACP